LHDNVLISNREGTIVILGPPDTLIESNRIVAGPDSEVGVRVDDGPGTVVRDNVVLTTDDFRPSDVDEDVLLTDNTTG